MRTERRREQDRAYEQRRKARAKSDPEFAERRREQERQKSQRRIELARQFPEIRQRLNARARIRNRTNRGAWPVPCVFVCSDCGMAKAQEYHHEDYSLWWSVEPLCRRCHGKRHQIN